MISMDVSIIQVTMGECHILSHLLVTSPPLAATYN